MYQTPEAVDCYLDRFFDFPNGYLERNGNIIRLRRRATEKDELDLVYGEKNISDPDVINEILEEHRKIGGELVLVFEIPTTQYTFENKKVEVCQMPDNTYILLEDPSTSHKFKEIYSLINSLDKSFDKSFEKNFEKNFNKFYENDPFEWFNLKASLNGYLLRQWFAKVHKGRFYRYYPMFADKSAYDLTVYSVDELLKLGFTDEDAKLFHKTVKCASNSVSPFLYELVRKDISQFQKEDFGPLPLLKADLIAEWSNIPYEKAETIEEFLDSNFF